MGAVDAIGEIPGGFGHTDRRFLHRIRLSDFTDTSTGLVSDRISIHETRRKQRNVKAKLAAGHNTCCGELLHR